MEEIDAIGNEDLLIRNKESNWNEILYGKKYFNKKDATEIKEILKDFRK